MDLAFVLLLGAVGFGFGWSAGFLGTSCRSHTDWDSEDIPE